jgi:hypothetical protein
MGKPCLERVRSSLGAQDRKEGQCLKHIDTIHDFARVHVASGELSFLHCKSEDNVSDCLT